MTMIGIDPHKATHTVVAVDDNEQVLDEFKLRASTTQTERLCEWAVGFDKREWAIESANELVLAGFVLPSNQGTHLNLQTVVDAGVVVDRSRGTSQETHIVQPVSTGYPSEIDAL